MRRILFPPLTAVAILAASAGAGMAQGTPSPQPGPTNPNPPSNNPLAQPGATMVINPTVDQCRRGWDSTMKWTKDQFDRYCATLRASK